MASAGERAILDPLYRTWHDEATVENGCFVSQPPKSSVESGGSLGGCPSEYSDWYVSMRT